MGKYRRLLKCDVVYNKMLFLIMCCFMNYGHIFLFTTILG
jgi:hypothetical protein